MKRLKNELREFKEDIRENKKEKEGLLKKVKTNSIEEKEFLEEYEKLTQVNRNIEDRIKDIRYYLNILKGRRYIESDNPKKIADFANSYLELKQYYNVSFIVHFKKPTELSTGHSTCKTTKKHKVKKLFYKNGRLYYVAGRLKRRGSSTVMTPSKVEVVLKEKNYREEWERIMKSMKRLKINKGVVKSIQNHLDGKTDYIEGFQTDPSIYTKPRKMSFKDVLDYHDETFESMIKCKDRISLWKKGSKRDRSVDLIKHEDIGMRYLAASEYSNCGNGDYYMMYSPTMAFYAETD